MWYSVLKHELEVQKNFAGSTYTVPAGTIWLVKKCEVGGKVGVKAIHQFGDLADLYLTVNEARSLMTTPTKDLDTAMEESFMISEAVYC